VKDSKDYNYTDDDFSWEKYFEILYGNSVDEEKISILRRSIDVNFIINNIYIFIF